jgi:hypothetical protein
MLIEIEQFVNWVRRHSPGARTWRDYGCDLRMFVAAIARLAKSHSTMWIGLLASHRLKFCVIILLVRIRRSQ